MIGVVCKYAPIEVLSGLDTVERIIIEHSENVCGSCMHANMCSLTKDLYETIKKRHITKVVLTSCCDATRNLYEILVKEEWMEFVYFLPLPHKNEEREIQYFFSEIKKMIHAYENTFHVHWDADKAFRSFKKVDLYQEDRPYIRIAGAQSTLSLRKMVEEVFDGYPIHDETCWGTRYVEEAKDLETYSFHLLQQIRPCQRMYWHSPVTSLHGKVLGTVFHTVKFCEFYGFLKEKEREEVVPMVEVESEGTVASEQLRTRLEALKEEIECLEKKEIQKMYSVGIDCGSTTCEAILMDKEKQILAKSLVTSSTGSSLAIHKALQEVLEIGKVTKEEVNIVLTGYGRKHSDIVGKDVTEITAHAIGAKYLEPETKTIIDIGGQDAKVICLKENGKVERFTMNDKCAAGTGRFLQMQAQALQLDMDEFCALGSKSRHQVEITSVCSVFAESEVVSLKAKNVPMEDIIKGLSTSVARRVGSMVKAMKGTPVYFFTGGVAKNEVVKQCLEEVLQEEVRVSKDSQYCGAIGAALLGVQDAD